jgi:hypothetical protein
VDAAQLEGYKKRRRATLEERLESVLKGREAFQASTHAGGLTNLEKQRKKNYLMVRKGKTSLRMKARGDGSSRSGGKRGKSGRQQNKVQLKRDKRKKRRT